MVKGCLWHVGSMVIVMQGTVAGVAVVENMCVNTHFNGIPRKACLC